VLTAQNAVDDMPLVDFEAMDREVEWDIARFADRDRTTMVEKAILAKYVTKITAEIKPVTDEYWPHFEFKITAPVIEEPVFEPTTGKNGNSGKNGKDPVRVQQGGTIGGVPPTPRRSKLTTPCSAY